MSRIICAVLNDSPDYVNRFLMYFKTHKKYSFEMIGFTSQQALEEYLSVSVVDILLLSRSFHNVYEAAKSFKREEVTDQGKNASEKIHEFIILGEQQDLTSVPKKIDRYRPMRQIAQDLTQIASEHIRRKSRENDAAFETYALYSLGRMSDPYEFAVKLSETFADEEQVLYMDLDTFSPLSMSSERPEKPAMSDLIYGALTDNSLFEAALHDTVDKTERPSVLCAPVSLKDLDEISSIGWNAFLMRIARAGGFSRIILNITDSCRDMLALFAESSLVYILTGNCDSTYTKSRSESFGKYFELRGRSDITGKFRQAI